MDILVWNCIQVLLLLHVLEISKYLRGFYQQKSSGDLLLILSINCVQHAEYQIIYVFNVNCPLEYSNQCNYNSEACYFIKAVSRNVKYLNRRIYEVDFLHNSCAYYICQVILKINLDRIFLSISKVIIITTVYSY